MFQYWFIGIIILALLKCIGWHVYLAIKLVAIEAKEPYQEGGTDVENQNPAVDLRDLIEAECSSASVETLQNVLADLEHNPDRLNDIRPGIKEAVADIARHHLDIKLSENAKIVTA